MFRAFAILAIYGILASAACATCALDPARPDTLRASGTLTYAVFPGAPNFEDVRKGDQPEPAYILRLKKPICASNMEGIEEGKHDVSTSTIQVIAESPPATAGLQRMRGKRVKVQGTRLMEAHTGHHHAPLLLWITAIAPD